MTSRAALRKQARHNIDFIRKGAVVSKAALQDKFAGKIMDQSFLTSGKNGGAHIAKDGVHRTIIVTAGDSRIAPLTRGLIRSIQSFPESHSVELGCFDVGQSEEDRRWLRDRGVEIAVPGTHFGVAADRLPKFALAQIARPFFCDYFPGRDIYIWMDSDIWLQRWWVIDAYRDGALATGFAIAHEREKAYAFQSWLFGWFAKHMVLGYGVADAAWMLSRPHLNSGLFAMRADSPHWKLWRDHYKRALSKARSYTPHDQFSINRMVYGGAFSRPEITSTLLPPTCNWICARGTPMWNDVEGTLCEPYAPYRTIGAVHLAGPAKHTRYAIRRTGGRTFDAILTQGLTAPL